MRYVKIGGVIALLFFGSATYDSALADEGRESLLKAKDLCAERLKSGNGYEKVLADDGTLVVCAKGEKIIWSETAGTDTHLTDAEKQTCKAGIQNFADILRQTGFSAEPAAKMLITALVHSAKEMRESGTYDYAVTDALFSQLNEVLLTLDWQNKDNSTIIAELAEIIHFGSKHGKYYGAQAISLFANLLSLPDLSKYDRENVLFFLEQSINSTLFPFSVFNQISVKEIPESEKLTPAEFIALAEVLLQFYRDNPGIFIILRWGAEDVLAEIAPHVLAELKEIQERREQEREYKELLDAN